MNNVAPAGTLVNDHERSVLGGMMLSKSAVWDVLDILDPQDFADWRHETVFRAISALANRNEPTDAISVSAELDRMNELAKIGGAGELHMMSSDVPTASNAGYYADVVKQGAIKRRLIEAGTRIVSEANNEGDAFELAENARAEIDRAASSARIEISSVGDDLDDVIKRLKEQPRFVESPWRDINALINGFRPGALYVIGARPGSGKTIMGLQAAVGLARHGHVAFSSLEMDSSDLTKRMFSLKGSIHMSSLTKNVLTPSEWGMIDELRPRIQKMPLFIDDRSGVTITQIKAFARSVSRRGELSAVVVDYLQLITGTDSRKPRHETVAEISRQLKIMSRELNVPVIALSQLNRESEARHGARRLPTLSDLRESGSIEQDADVVLLLQRGMDEFEQPSDELDVVIAKNRHGSTGKVTLLWEGQFARVTTAPWSQ
jgi:replicative DNA helicase